MKFGIAIVVECKNYANFLTENQMIITSKYLGKKKLTLLGLVLTRRGLGESAQYAQIDKWKEDEKMMVCLVDEDLAKMLDLREKNEEPWKVIDKAIRNFLEGV